MSLREDALRYHQEPVPGKISIQPTKSMESQKDLTLAYSPGVAEPCLEIEKNPDLAYTYTSKGNLVAVISNGTAVLGLGDIGSLASKPVMEGKSVLFKKFAGIDSVDIEIDSTNTEEIIRTVELIGETFGGINLEDFKAPECFEIETELKKRLGIPVFHDDQHGTAVIGLAALMSAMDIAGKKKEDIRVVINGAGASGITMVKFFKSYGIKNVVVCDTKGVIYEGRPEGMNPQKHEVAVKTELRTLAEAAKGADVLVGLSAEGAFTEEMVKSMADRPVIFALANPNPEIRPEVAKSVRPDVIMATGRSDYPNQVNNVLCFPFLFRGALDCRATGITEGMKMAAAEALAKLAKEPVPQEVLDAYGVKSMEFSAEYLIPKPTDTRVMVEVSAAVVKAAMADGVAKIKIDDMDAYKASLHKLVS